MHCRHRFRPLILCAVLLWCGVFLNLGLLWSLYVRFDRIEDRLREMRKPVVIYRWVEEGAADERMRENKSR